MYHAEIMFKILAILMLKTMFSEKVVNFMNYNTVRASCRGEQSMKILCTALTAWWVRPFLFSASCVTFETVETSKLDAEGMTLILCLLSS